MGIPYVVDRLGELSRVLEEKEELYPVHTPKAQAGFLALASAHKSWVGLWRVRGGGVGGPILTN